MRCKYCDTKYAYEDGVYMSVEDIIEKIKKFNIKLVEITGGEPMFQKETPALIKTLIKLKYKVLIETNGSISLKSLPKKTVKIVDIKCPASGEHKKVLWKNLDYLDSKDQLKFVISNKKDYIWAKEKIKKYLLENKYELLFSATNKNIYPKMAKWIIKDGLFVRIQVQLHKILWPENKRGV